MLKTIFMIIAYLCVHTIEKDSVQGQWTYISVDSSRQKWGDFAEPEWLRYFGLDFWDVNHDELMDIVSGRYVYLNPGGPMRGPWERINLGFNVDGMIATDIDGDSHADIIAQALPDVYWLEADNKNANSWKARKIARLPKTGHVNGQGYRLADIFKGGKPEIVMAAEGGVFAIPVPDNPDYSKWKTYHLVKSKSSEGFDCADMDGDGDLDIVAGNSSGMDGEHADLLSWYQNPGNDYAEWNAHRIGNTVNAIDRVEIADFNGDGLMDVAVAEEQWPPEGPTAYLFWFEQMKTGDDMSWKRHTVVEQWSLHNLDAGDVDWDGDIDLVTCEHKGDDLKLQLWINDGSGNFSEKLIDKGRESHLGTQFCDLDKDGDLDIVSIAWDDYRFVHLWRNDSINFHPAMPYWSRITNSNFDFPISKTGSRVAALIFDVDRDGIDDFVVAAYTGMEWYKKTDQGNRSGLNPEISWKRFAVELGYDVHIEAGGDYFDIDGDGDLDIVMGGSRESDQVWWWENPYPDFKTGKPWKRYLIKEGGGLQHHDQIIGDFDGDGRTELVFWNQGAKTLFRAILPDRPKKQTNWKPEKIYTWAEGPNREGLDVADIDRDGLIDIVGGGMWFKYNGGVFKPMLIDDYPMSRSVVGDFISGGRPEVIIGSGDRVGPLNIYEWRNETWQRHTLIKYVDHGHTLQACDINGDGYLDIYTATMHSPGAGAHAKQWILYGDGKGHFRRQLISFGSGTHEGKIGDLDGDGDLDILQKDFNHQRHITVWLNNGIAVQPGQVSISECFYKGSDHFKISTLSATYFLEKSSGGFSSVIDRAGTDWVNWQRNSRASYPESAAGEFRGIPNMLYGDVADAGAGHPGFDACKSVVRVQDNKVRCTSISGSFIWSWTFFDDYVKLDVEQVGNDQKYWILYEGPVAGKYYPLTKYWGTDRGMRSEIPDYYNGETIAENWRWIYFGDKNVDRIFFAAQEKSDTLPDIMGYLGASEYGLKAKDGMVVFGFGRNLNTEALFSAPNTFYFGFFERKINSSSDYNNLKSFIEKLIE